MRPRTRAHRCVAPRPSAPESTTPPPSPATPANEPPPRTPPARWLHVVLQHRTGPGGLLAAAVLTEYLRTAGAPAFGVDLDPAAYAFSEYTTLDVRRVVARDDRGAWSFERSMDAAVEAVAAAGPAGAAAVVDGSAPGFLGFFPYAAEGALAPALAGAGVRLVLHAVTPTGEDVPAGAAAAYARDAGLPADTPVVCWLDDGMFGPYSTRHLGQDRYARAHDALVAAVSRRYRVAGAVHLPAIARPHGVRSTGRGSEHHWGAPLTFTEALRSDRLGVVAKQRLAAVRDDVFGQLARALAAARLNATHPRAGRAAAPDARRAYFGDADQSFRSKAITQFAPSRSGVSLEADHHGRA